MPGSDHQSSTCVALVRGSATYSPFRPWWNAIAVQRLRAMGAILIEIAGQAGAPGEGKPN